MIIYILIFTASLAPFSCGVNIVWTSPVIWKLESNNTDINPLGQPLTTFQIALITSFMPLGAGFGSLFLTKLCDIIGRKKTLILLSTITIFLNTILSFSSHIYIFYIARLLIGACAGVAISVTSVYLSEISEDHNRGIVGCFTGLSLPLGNLFVYLLGPMFSIKIFTLLCCIPNLINILCCLIYIPESPVYLASKGKRKEAIIALEQLRNKKSSEIEKEYEMVMQSKTSNEKKVTWKIMFSVRSLRKGFVIAVTLIVIRQLSGIGAILAYAGPLFDTAGCSLTGDTVAILIGLIYVFGGLLAIIVIEKVGRKPLLIISILGGSISHFFLGLYFHLKHINSLMLKNILWTPIISILVYILLFALGLAVIPPAMMSELFPSNAKPKAASACGFINFFLFFVTTTIFPIANDFIGPSWCLWIFCIVEFLSFIFVYFLVPEIKGKSLSQVQ